MEQHVRSASRPCGIGVAWPVSATRPFHVDGAGWQPGGAATKKTGAERPRILRLHDQRARSRTHAAGAVGDGHADIAGERARISGDQTRCLRVQIIGHAIAIDIKRVGVRRRAAAGVGRNRNALTGDQRIGAGVQIHSRRNAGADAVMAGQAARIRIKPVAQPAGLIAAAFPGRAQASVVIVARRIAAQRGAAGEHAAQMVVCIDQARTG